MDPLPSYLPVNGFKVVQYDLHVHSTCLGRAVRLCTAGT
jgi:hypothetical protein